MILIGFYIWTLNSIKKELKQNSRKEKQIFIICTMLLCFLAIPYRSYLISQGYENGLANLDMQYYTSLANRIKDMSISDGFRTISHHWNFAQSNFIQIWGYRLYIYFLVVTVYKWTMFSVTTSIYLVSIWQVILGLYSMLRIYNSIKEDFIRQKNTSLFFMLMAPPVWYGCVRLLREAFMLLCMEIMICALLRKEGKWRLRILLSMIVLTILRPYYAAFMVPLLFLLIGKEVWALAVEAGMFVLLCVVSAVVHVAPITVLSVVLSPNFFNQVIYVVKDALEVSSTGQIPLIIFIGSIWNFVLLFYSVLSLIFNRNLNYRCWCSLGLILDICMTYSIRFGGASELRHKMFFVIPYIILLNNGEFNFAGENGRRAFVMNFGLVMFMTLYVLIVALIHP